MVRATVTGKGQNRRLEWRKRRARYRRQIAARQGGIHAQCGWLVACFWCGWWEPQNKLTVEHIVPVSEGGAKLDLANLALAHAPCNNNRHRDGL